MEDVKRLELFLATGTETGMLVCGEIRVRIPECLMRMLCEGRSDEAFGIVRNRIANPHRKKSAIAAIAACCACCCAFNREPAYAIARKLCARSIDLLSFVSCYEKASCEIRGSTGWNAMQKRFVSDWYLEKNAFALASATLENDRVDEWTHADVIRLAHPKTVDALASSMFAYISRGKKVFDSKLSQEKCKDKTRLVEYIDAFDALKTTQDPLEACVAIGIHGFTQRMVPDAFSSDPNVWYALMRRATISEMLKHLNQMSAAKLFEKHADAKKILRATLLNETEIRKHSIRPFEALVAMRSYAIGSEASLSWKPQKDVSVLLESAVNLSIQNVVPIDKRILLSLDVSTSMTWKRMQAADNSAKASDVAATLALVFSSVEPNCEIMGFYDSFRKIEVSLSSSLDETIESLYSDTFGPTDLSMPMLWAVSNRKSFDAFVIVTDEETPLNRVPPADALRAYRAAMGSPSAKLVVVFPSGSRGSMFDASEGILAIEGFDDDAFESIRGFLHS